MIFRSKKAIAADLDELGELRTKYAALRQQYKTMERQRDDARWEIRHIASSQADLIIRRTRERDEAVRGLHTTEDQLAAARERLALYGGRLTVSDLTERHDVSRRALADALGPQLRHMNWDQLIEEARRTYKACAAWADDCRELKKRLSAADGVRASLVNQIEELRKCNDDLSRQAVDRAGNLTSEVAG